MYEVQVINVKILKEKMTFVKRKLLLKIVYVSCICLTTNNKIDRVLHFIHLYVL